MNGWIIGTGAYLLWASLSMPHAPPKVFVIAAIETRQDCITGTEVIAQYVRHAYNAYCFDPTGHWIALTAIGK